MTTMQGMFVEAEQKDAALTPALRCAYRACCQQLAWEGLWNHELNRLLPCYASYMPYASQHMHVHCLKPHPCEPLVHPNTPLLPRSLSNISLTGKEGGAAEVVDDTEAAGPAAAAGAGAALPACDLRVRPPTLRGAGASSMGPESASATATAAASASPDAFEGRAAFLRVAAAALAGGGGGGAPLVFLGGPAFRAAAGSDSGSLDPESFRVLPLAA